MKDALTGFVRAVAILFVLLLIMNMVKYIVYGIPKEEIKIVEDSGNEENKYDNNYEYKELFSNYDYTVIQENFGEDFKDLYFANSLNNDFYLFSSVISLSKNNFVLFCNNTMKIMGDEVSSRVKKLYGNVEFTPASYTTKNGLISIVYNAKENTYTVTNKKCSGLNADEAHVDTILLGGKTTDNILEVYFTAHYIEYSKENGLLKVVHHKDVSPASSIVNKPNEDNAFTKYKLVFEKNGDNVIFKKLERTK